MILRLTLLAFLFGCQDYNSSTGDKKRFTKVELTGSARFQQAYYVSLNRCASCHQGSHAEYGTYTDEQDWVDVGLVVPGNPDASAFINNIINHGGDMPLGEGPLPEDEYQTLVDWVQNFQQ